MSDQRVRKLERDATSGSVDARAALLRERLRNETVDLAKVRFAAFLGDKASRMVCGEPKIFVPAWKDFDHNELMEWAYRSRSFAPARLIEGACPDCHGTGRRQIRYVTGTYSPVPCTRCEESGKTLLNIGFRWYSTRMALAAAKLVVPYWSRAQVRRRHGLALEQAVFLAEAWLKNPTEENRHRWESSASLLVNRDRLRWVPCPDYRDAGVALSASADEISTAARQASPLPFGINPTEATIRAHGVHVVRLAIREDLIPSLLS